MSKTPHPNTAKIELDFPIQISGAEVQYLVMRRPKVRDMITAQKAGGGDDAETGLVLISNLCEITRDELLELDSADWKKLEEQVVLFQKAKP